MGGHFRRNKTLQKILARFYWEGMAGDIRNYVRSCDVCQCTNDVKCMKTDTCLHPIPVQTKVWSQVRAVIFPDTVCTNENPIIKVGIDMVGQLPVTANGNMYVIILMDYFSKWPEAEPVKDKQAETVASFLYRMIARFVIKLMFEIKYLYFNYHM